MKKLIITLFTLLLLSATVFAGVEQNLNDRIEQIEDRIEELQDELKKYGNKKFKITENDKMKVDPSRLYGGKATFSFLKIEFNLKTIKPIFTYVGGKTLKYYKNALKAFKNHSVYSNKRYRKLFKNVRYAVFYFNLYLKKEENRKKLEEMFNKRIAYLKKRINLLTVIKNNKIKQSNSTIGNRALIFIGLNAGAGWGGGLYNTVDGYVGLRFEYLHKINIQRKFNYGFVLNVNYEVISDSNKSYFPKGINQKYLKFDAMVLLSALGYKHSVFISIGPSMCVLLSNNTNVDLYNYRKFLFGINIELGYKLITSNLGFSFFIGITLSTYTKRNDFIEKNDFFIGAKTGFLFNLN